jgi:hypothetical protein
MMMTTIAKRPCKLAKHVLQSELDLELSFQPAAIAQLHRKLERLITALSFRFRGKLPRGLVSRLRETVSKALGGLPSADVEAREFEARLNRLCQLPDEQPPLTKPLRDYLAQFEHALTTDGPRQWCSLSRDVRVETAVLVIVDVIEQYEDLLRKALDLFERAVNASGSIPDGRRYARNIGVRRKRLEALYREVFKLLDDRRSFLRMKSELLMGYRGKFVAFANGELVAADNSWESLLAKVQSYPGCYVELVDDVAFQETLPIVAPAALEVSAAEDLSR